MCGENLFEMKYELTSLASYAQPRITTFCFFHILSILFFLLDNHSFFFLEHGWELRIISLREKKKNSKKEGEEPPSLRETLDQSK